MSDGLGGRSSFDELDSIPVAEGVVWHPVRRRLGIRAFGINAYTAEDVGGHVVEEHDETTAAAPAATRSCTSSSAAARPSRSTARRVDAPAGTLVFIRDPTVRRVAIAEEEGTLVLAVGGEPGTAVRGLAVGERTSSRCRALHAGRWDEAIALIEDALREHPGNASTLYNLASAYRPPARAPLPSAPRTHPFARRTPRSRAPRQRSLPGSGRESATGPSPAVPPASRAEAALRR